MQCTFWATLHAQVTRCLSEGCVRSGLDFKASGISIVRYCLSNYMPQGHRDVENVTWAVFEVRCGNT